MQYGKEEEHLFEILSSIDKKDDIKKLLEDLCTIKEVKEMSKRLQAAYLLSDGMKYTDVTKKTGVSSATLARINKCINYGAGGYKKIINDRRKGYEK